MRKLKAFLCFILFTFLRCSQAIDLEYQLIEEKPIGTVVGNVKTDSSLRTEMTDDEFSRLQFQILTEGNAYAPFFSIDDKNGILQSASVLDREKICELLLQCILGFSVSVFKKGIENPEDLEFVKFLQINVEILDINDNSPVFQLPEVTVNVSESVPVGYIILTNTASDKDSGTDNSVQVYQISPLNDIFDVKLVENGDGTSNLGIILNRKLDREMENSYSLTIIAKDNGNPQRNGSVEVKINVLDSNDNSPVFEKPAYSINVVENPIIDSILLEVLATDSDIKENAQISYHFSSSTSRKVQQLLKLNETTGKILVKGVIDYEIDEQLIFYVEAQDHGNPSRSSQVMVTINVTDINDNAPSININLPPGGDHISENAEIGQYIATIGVQDGDSGVNGSVSCEIKDNKFELTEVQKNFYKINLKNNLDREIKAKHNVTISCSDKGTPSKQNSSSFIVNVDDVNDNEPVFTNSVYRPTLYENNDIGDIVAIVTANDIDEGQNGEVRYFLNYNVSDMFSISPSSGIITAKQVFDREVIDKIQFTVSAFDNGIPRHNSTALVIVTIGDKNDHEPVFTKSLYTFTVQENLVPGTVIGGIYASDNDTGTNGRLTFLQNHQFSSIFQIKQSNGDIMVIDVLDRESRDKYEFNLTVSDNGSPPRKSTTKIEIFIEDENDNFPVITFPTKGNNSVEIQSTLEVDSIITMVTSYDLDLGKNAELTFHIIQGDPGNRFIIQNKTGKIILNKPLHAEDYGTYSLLIAVQDGGIPQRTSWTDLMLTVTSSDGKKNMLIAITVCTITAIFSAAMIIVICIIRKRDSMKDDHQKMDPEKKSFIHEWLKCLSSSTKELKGLGTNKTTEPGRAAVTLDKKLTVDGTEVTSSLTDDRQKEFTDHSIKPKNTNENNLTAFVAPPMRLSPSNVRYEDGNNNKDIWTTGKYFEEERRVTSEDNPSLVFHKRYTPESYQQILQTAVSDLSLSDSWKELQQIRRPQYDRNISLDEEMFRHNRRPILHSASSFRSNYDIRGTDLQDSGVFSQTDSLKSNSNSVQPYESHSLNRHTRPNGHMTKSGFSSSFSKPVYKHELPPIRATPEPFTNQSFEETGSNIIDPPSQFVADSDSYIHTKWYKHPHRGQTSNYANDFIELGGHISNNDLIV